MAGSMDSELLLKFIRYFPDYLSALSHTPLHFFWRSFVETAVFNTSYSDVPQLLQLLEWNVVGGLRRN